MPAEVLSRGGLVALVVTLGLLATSCGGGGGSTDPIKIAFLTDCTSEFAGPAADAGAELPFLQRGARLRGPDPSNGVTDATVSRRRVRLLLACESYLNFTTLLTALRRLVEDQGADIVVLPGYTGEGLVLKKYARQHPKVTFSTASGEQSTTLKNPAPNLFSFVPDAAQGIAGLGAYAYRTLGWRTAVTVGEDDPYGWAQVAGFAAEFCSLGGHLRKPVWTPVTKSNFAGTVKRIPRHGVDGVVFPSDLQPTGRFIKAWGRRYPRGRFADRLLVNAAGLDDALKDDVLTGPLRNRMQGVVGVSWLPRTATAALHGADPFSYDSMEPVLRALEQVHGDLSDGERAFRRALARVRFRAPNGPTTLNARRQAIAPTYLDQVERGAHGRLVIRQIGVVPKVEQTFGGYFSSRTPPPSRQPICERKKPPAWVNSVPATR